MGRTRRSGAARAGSRATARRRGHGRRLKARHAALAAACCFTVPGCSGLTSGADTPVAIQIIAKPDSVHVGDTVVLQVRALNRAGDSIVGTPITLISLNPDTMGIDSARLAVIGRILGTGRIIARSGDLRTDPFTILVK